jgi:hypothetical protein
VGPSRTTAVVHGEKEWGPRGRRRGARGGRRGGRRGSGTQGGQRRRSVQNFGARRRRFVSRQDLENFQSAAAIYKGKQHWRSTLPNLQQ